MKIENESTGNRGGWVLALAPVAVVLALFVPLHDPFTFVAGRTWLAPDLLGPLLALFLATVLFWAFRKDFWPHGHHERRKLRNGAVLLVGQAVLLRAAAEFGERAGALGWSWWPPDMWLWNPWFLTSGLAVMLLGSNSGVLLSLSGVFLLYLRADPGPLPLVGCLMSSLSGILFLRRATRRRVLQAGVGTGVLLGIVAVVQAVQTGATPLTIAAFGLAPVAVGLLGAFSVLAFLPVLEWALGELSDISLAEYGCNHPLLEQLKERAPGTWHHSLNVADLAEKAAAAIGARSLLCKVAALYHDVGKLKDPLIFAENITGPSPHENLDPRCSAERIIAHVTHGLELARKHRLPAPFREIIAEHHGVSVVRFFYNKACAQLREGEPETSEALCSLFSYPGPPPSSRESGIIALADVVEAATRSSGAQPSTEAREFVRELIANRVAEGELAQCPLTLADLARIEDSFGVWVTARQHHRPAYPKDNALSIRHASQEAKPGARSGSVAF